MCCFKLNIVLNRKHVKIPCLATKLWRSCAAFFGQILNYYCIVCPYQNTLIFQFGKENSSRLRVQPLTPYSLCAISIVLVTKFLDHTDRLIPRPNPELKHPWLCLDLLELVAKICPCACLLAVTISLSALLGAENLGFWLPSPLILVSGNVKGVVVYMCKRANGISSMQEAMRPSMCR